MVTISVGCGRTIQNLNGPQKSEIFQRTPQVKWMTSQVISKITKL